MRTGGSREEREREQKEAAHRGRPEEAKRKQAAEEKTRREELQKKNMEHEELLRQSREMEEPPKAVHADCGVVANPCDAPKVDAAGEAVVMVGFT